MEPDDLTVTENAASATGPNFIPPMHLALDGRLTSLYAPEFRFEASFTGQVPKRITLSGKFDDMDLCIVHSSGCTPHPNGRDLLFASENTRFAFVVAWKDKNMELAPVTGLQGLKSLMTGLFPFESHLFKLGFKSDDGSLTTSIHTELPHHLTRYTKDTKNLQHTFSEQGLRGSSFMTGIAPPGEIFQMHLHYKSLDAFRRISIPLITMIWVLLLDLAVMEYTQRKGNGHWSDQPGAILAFLSINASAFVTLAAIRVGSTLRSLLNLVRLLGVLWVLMLTVAIRESSIPYLRLYIGKIVDAGIKLSIAGLCVTAIFSFIVYALVRESERRGKWFAGLAGIGFVGWIVLVLLADKFQLANAFSLLLQR